MIAFESFQFTTQAGRGCLTEWLRKNGDARAATDARVDQLRLYGVGAEETLSYCPHIRDGIYKLKIKMKPQFRPHLCRGPFDMKGEFTFLQMAIEENKKLQPSDVEQRALQNRTTLMSDQTRRVRYE